MKYITYSKDMIEKPIIMVDNEDLPGFFSWDQAHKMIDILNSFKYKGFSNWRLPSRVELEYLYLNKEDIGGFASAYYWSSTETINTNAWLQNFDDGTQGTNIKHATYRVRAVCNIV